MRRRWIRASILGVLLLAASAGGARAESATAARSCDATPELAAARRALERGDTRDALEHLRAADAILARCEPAAPSAAPGTPEGRMAADALGQVGEARSGELCS